MYSEILGVAFGVPETQTKKEVRIEESVEDLAKLLEQKELKRILKENGNNDH